MADDTRFKERLRAAADAPTPIPALDRVSRRARVLRARRLLGGALATAIAVAAIVLPLSSLRHLGDAPGAAVKPGVGERLTFAPADGWSVIDTGPTAGLRQSAVTANFDIAARAPQEMLDLVDAGVWRPTEGALDPTDIVITTMCCGQVNPEAPTPGNPAVDLPLTVPSGPPETSWEGNTSGTSRYRVYGLVEGNPIGVEVYFGTSQPGPAMVADAETALARLVVPPSQTYTDTLDLDGIHAEMAPGWDGQLSGGVLIASTMPLAGNDHGSYMPNRSSLGPDDASIVLMENEGINVGFPHADPPITISAGDRCDGCYFEPDNARAPADHALYHHTFETAGREFDLWVEFGGLQPTDAALARVASVLDTLRVDRAGSGGEYLSNYVGAGGVSMGLPADWSWSTDVGPNGLTMHVASVPVNDPVSAANGLEAGDALISLDEQRGQDLSAYPELDLSTYPSPTPLSLTGAGVCTACEEGLPDGYGAWASRFRVGDRAFAIHVSFGSFPPPADALARVNQILATLDVDPNAAPNEQQPLPEGQEIVATAGTVEPFAYDGLRGDVPPGWTLRTNPIPGLQEPVVPVAFGSSPFPAGGDCGPDAALRQMPTDGVFAWLYEFPQRPGNAGDFTHGWIYWPRERWRDEPLSTYECTPSRATARFQMEVGGRFFELHVAVGPNASDQTLSQLTALLSSLEVDN